MTLSNATNAVLDRLFIEDGYPISVMLAFADVYRDQGVGNEPSTPYLTVAPTPSGIIAAFA